jgi:hypothetical protein
VGASERSLHDDTPEPRQVAFARHNVVAVFADMEQGRDAVDALGGAGIDGSEISVLGRPIEEAAGRTDTRDRDAAVAREVASKTAAGAAAGTAVGGVAGFLAGLVAFAIPGIGPVLGAGVWAATAAGGVAGGALGGVLGGVSATDMTDAWELTFDSVREGRVLVGVHSDSESDVARGEETLAKHNPLRLERFDANGRRLVPPQPGAREGTPGVVSSEDDAARS